MEPIAGSFTSEQLKRILDLAFDYLSIDPDEKEKIITKLEDQPEQYLHTSITDIFQQENLVGDEELAILSIFDEHLQTLCLDLQFGKIAVANKLATKQDVAKALKYQEDYFTKYRINMPIGDVLIDNKSITQSDRVSILLTQNRIKNENLFDALNHIGTTLLQKDAVNKRFGVLAIKNELVTIEQVNAALEIQEEEKSAQKKARFIGQILQETADLSDDDIEPILVEQKLFEKRRLDLENALYTFKSEIKISKKLNRLLTYTINEGGVEVFVKKTAESDEVIPTYEFLLWLRRVGVIFGIVNDAVLEEFLQKAEINKEVLVARGIAPKPPVDEDIRFTFENEFTKASQESAMADSDQVETGDDKEAGQETEPEKKPDDPESDVPENDAVEADNGEDAEKENIEENNKEKEDKTVADGDSESDAKENGDEQVEHDSILVKKGALLAAIIPGKNGKPGKDVLGKPIQPGKPGTCPFNAGSGVIRKGKNFFARIDGCPVLINDTTLVVETIEQKSRIKTINGSISYDTKENYVSQDVELNGDIAPGAVLRCHSLLLRGNLHGCVICTGDIEVKGEIRTQEKQEDDKPDDQTAVLCQGSVNVSKSIINTKIQAKGEIIAFNSQVVGSELLAFKGMTIKDVVKGKEKPSTLLFGLEPGDKTIALDNTIETKKAELPVLKKEAEIAVLTQEYKTELEKEETRQMEQDILNNLVEIIDAPELYQQETLEKKIRYLNRLPDFSSIKAYYLKLPETENGMTFFNRMIMSSKNMSLEDLLEQIKKQLETKNQTQAETETVSESETEAGDEDGVSTIEHIEIQYKSRLAALEAEVGGASEEIEKIESEISNLQALKAKLISRHLNSVSQSNCAIRIKNECEKGTIIQGKLARLVVEKSVYNSQFKEVTNPATQSASILITSG